MLLRSIRLLPLRFFARAHSTDSNTTHFGYDEVPENEKQTRVNEVFSSVADKYDLMNDVMSFGIHRIWKDYFIRVIRPDPQWNYIDVAGGTGDIAFRYLKELDRYYPSSTQPSAEPSITPTHTFIADNLKQTRIQPTSKCVVADINPNMLAVGKQRAIDNNLHDRIQWVETNAEELPFDNEQFDFYTIAFGIRNCTHIDRVVSEAYRVLKKGGRFLCLEFSQVNNTLLRYAYDEYSKTFIPPMGQIIANDWKSYQYLIESIRVFPKQKEFADLIRSCQFRYVTYENLSFGVAAIHSGYKL
jgi:2-methoxy-6-polyprenyl-1,4-benzoquinol methylase